MFDIIVGTVLAVLVIPIVALLALGAATSLRCWPFFVQQRVGYRGRRFSMLKLRTLPRHVPRYTDKYALNGVKLPWFVRFLRDHHLDELPQLFQVPLGHMSLVGPRPEMEYLHAASEPRFAEIRTSVRPGCTGLWQVGADARRLIAEAPEYDVFYVRHASMSLDAWVLWRSVLAILGSSGPVTIGDVPTWARRLRGREAVSVGVSIGADDVDILAVRP